MTCSRPSSIVLRLSETMESAGQYTTTTALRFVLLELGCYVWLMITFCNVTGIFSGYLSLRTLYVVD